MAAYLRLVTQVRYLGSRLRKGVSILPRAQTQVNEALPSWDLTTFMKACSAVAGDRHLDARCRALPDRLLVEASQQGFPLALLSQPTEAAAHLEWRQSYGQILAEILQQVQGEWSEPARVETLVAIEPGVDRGLGARHRVLGGVHRTAMAFLRDL